MTLSNRPEVLASSVVISNGFGKFPLAAAAEEMERRGLLELLITGAYPREHRGLTEKLLFALLPSSRKRSRLDARRVAVLDKHIASLATSELLDQLAGVLERVPRLAQRCRIEAHRRYASGAHSALEAAVTKPKVYHFRAGFGLCSVAAARRLGAATVCDYSLAHPAVLQSVGALDIGDNFWTMVLDDAREADVLLVNSDFVRTSFVTQGWNPDRIVTVYMGIDDQFLRYVPSREGSTRGPMRIVYAGSVTHRKGVDVLFDALRRLRADWTLDFLPLGPVPSRFATRYADVLGSERVRVAPRAPRAAIAQVMSKADVCVVPSRAEGSARVAFEALACGCYVIATQPAGTIVEDGVHGRLVVSGDAIELVSALEDAASNRVRTSVIGRENARLIRARYTQEHYGRELERLYRRVVAR